MSNALNDVYSVLWVDLRNLRRHWRSTVATSLIQPILYLVAFGYGLDKVSTSVVLVILHLLSLVSLP